MINRKTSEEGNLEIWGLPAKTQITLFWGQWQNWEESIIGEHLTTVSWHTDAHALYILSRAETGQTFLTSDTYCLVCSKHFLFCYAASDTYCLVCSKHFLFAMLQVIRTALYAQNILCLLCCKWYVLPCSAQNIFCLLCCKWYVLPCSAQKHFLFAMLQVIRTALYAQNILCLLCCKWLHNRRFLRK